MYLVTKRLGHSLAASTMVIQELQKKRDHSDPPNMYSALADIRRGAQGTRAPLGTKFSLISCSFQEILIKLYPSAPPPEGWRPLLGEILDPPLQCTEQSYYIYQIKIPNVIIYILDSRANK